MSGDRLTREDLEQAKSMLAIPQPRRTLGPIHPDDKRHLEAHGWPNVPPDCRRCALITAQL